MNLNENIRLDQIRGYDDLGDKHKRTFEQFLSNFKRGWGFNARENIVPISVRFVNRNKYPYLRFDYLFHGDKTWLHVESPHTWY